MVSIREIMRMWKGKRGVTQDAAIEFQERAQQLVEALVNLSNFEAQKRGNNSRLRATDVRLAYLSMLDNRSEDEEVISRETEMTEEEFGDWNAE
tara:strand:- start:483 stop:764 length:282 start_codon:yes stop_codon:yes gene_type:complete